MEPALCLNCGTFPCTCGEQYKKLADREYFTLLHSLSKLRNDVDVYVHGTPIINKLNDIPDTKTSLFDHEDAELMPDDWRDYLLEFCTRSPSDQISIIAQDQSTETMKFPSGLILIILMRCNYSERDFARLFKYWLKDREDDVSRFIAPLIDDKAAYLKTSIAEIDSALLDISSAKERPNAIMLMIENALKATKYMLFAIKEKEMLDAAAMFMKLMYSIVALNEMPTKHTTDKEYLESEINFDIYYIEEGFRRFILEYLHKIDLPHLKMF